MVPMGVSTRHRSRRIEDSQMDGQRARYRQCVLADVQLACDGFDPIVQSGSEGLTVGRVDVVGRLHGFNIGARHQKEHHGTVALGRHGGQFVHVFGGPF